MKNKEKFLPHLYEPLRRQIAIQYIQHEWRKLFPRLHGKELWQSIDKQIADWYEVLTIRNFWNAIHGITIGFRLTSIVPWITSLNIKWEEKDIPINELEYSKQKNDGKPLNNDPIFVIRKEEKLRVIDGNNRVIKAITEGKTSIRAFVGEPTAEPPLFEHWVPTSLLVDLVFWHKKHFQADRDTTETIAKTIAELIRDSSAGQIEFEERAVHKDDEIHMKLLEAVQKILK